MCQKENENNSITTDNYPMIDWGGGNLLFPPNSLHNNVKGSSEFVFQAVHRVIVSLTIAHQNQTRFNVLWYINKSEQLNI